MLEESGCHMLSQQPFAVLVPLLKLPVVFTTFGSCFGWAESLATPLSERVCGCMWCFVCLALKMLMLMLQLNMAKGMGTVSCSGIFGGGCQRLLQSKDLKIPAFYIRLRPQLAVESCSLRFPTHWRFPRRGRWNDEVLPFSSDWFMKK